jgi:S1-C subfamily serine protease
MLIVLIGVMGVGAGVLIWTWVDAQGPRGRGNQAILPNRPLLGQGGEARPLLFAGPSASERQFGQPFSTDNLTQPQDLPADVRLCDKAERIFDDPIIPGESPRSLLGPKPESRGGPGVGLEAGTSLAPKVLERVKRATALVRVVRPDGQDGSGSGFFVESGILMTNAHVLGMLEREAAEPRRVELILNNGQADEARFPGKVLIVDRDHDLALVRVESPNPVLPAPLPVADGSKLIETQPVFIFGFPLGSSLGKAITVAESRVSSLRRDQNGILDRIQVTGGMHPGNSGGPVVDAAGNVVGVSVAIIKDTGINFAVSGERVNRLLAGRIDSLGLSYPRRVGDRHEWELKAVATDPLKRLQKVAVAWWWGQSAEKHPARRGQPQAPPTASIVELAPHSSTDFTGTLSLPANLPSGQVLWLQVRTIDSEGESSYEARWAELFTVPEPKTVRLNYRPRSGNHPIALKTDSALRVRRPDGDSHLLRVRADVTGEEKLLGQDDTGGWVWGVHLQKIDVSVRADDQVPRDPGIEAQTEHLPKLRVELRTDAQGRMTGGRCNLTEVPDEARMALGSFADDTARTLEFLSLSCPNRELAPGDSWTDPRDLAVLGAPAGVSVRMQLTYRYRGVVRQNDRDFALIEVSGTLAPGPNNPNLRGRAEGHLLADLQTGLVGHAFVRLQSAERNAATPDDDDEPGSSLADIEIRMRRQ